MRRRRFLLGGAALAVVVGPMGPASGRSDSGFEIAKSEADWRNSLSPEAFSVLRDHGTERAFSSPLLDESRTGTYSCAGCALPLYSSDTKFDSGTGWPSFWESIEGNVGTSRDWKMIIPRTEVHCRRCGGHLGHVFDDGPKPTGKRHCINGVAMAFTAA